MKQRIIVLLTITALIMGAVSFGVLATNEGGDGTPAADNTANAGTLQESGAAGDTANTNDPAQTTPAPEQQIQVVPEQVQTPAPAPAPTDFSETNVKRDNCIILDSALLNEHINQFKVTKKYPFVIDLSSFDESIDSIICPASVKDILVLEEKQPDPVEPVTNDNDGDNTNPQDEDAINETDAPDDQNVEDTEANQPAEVPADPDEIVLKVVTWNTEYSWKRKSLEEKEITADGLVKLSFASADQIAEDKNIKAPREKNELEFSPEDGKSQGILFVSKDNSGYWNITDAHMFDSGAAYVISIIFLVVLTFVVILAVNLIIIKIYRTRK